MFPKREVVVWGAGKWGRMAYALYQESCNIIGYVDSNSALWGTKLDGIPIYTPDILKTHDATVIIAVRRGAHDVKDMLLQTYGIQAAIVFRLSTTYEDTRFRPKENIFNEEIIVRFQGGLGNQMFQYALYKIYQKQGKRVTADLSSYLGVKSAHLSFRLLDVFSAAHIEPAASAVVFYYENLIHGFREPFLPKVVFNENDVLGLREGVVEGYFQSYRYPEIVKEELNKEFMFCQKQEQKMIELIRQLEEQESVSIHIRRGDYTGLSSIYGSLWGDDYYRRAIEWIKTRKKKVRFCFFSDDMEWTKERFQEENAIYIERRLFDEYEDWYDMCLMSHCKHNIIANSSFSWWGAWLNLNLNKIVIAPKTWMAQGDVLLDICPPEWLRM